jgi:hypothetical protein
MVVTFSNRFCAVFNLMVSKAEVFATLNRRISNFVPIVVTSCPPPTTIRQLKSRLRRALRLTYLHEALEQKLHFIMIARLVSMRKGGLSGPSPSLREFTKAVQVQEIQVFILVESIEL